MVLSITLNNQKMSEKEGTERWLQVIGKKNQQNEVLVFVFCHKNWRNVKTTSNVQIKAGSCFQSLTLVKKQYKVFLKDSVEVWSP